MHNYKIIVYTVFILYKFHSASISVVFPIPKSERFPRANVAFAFLLVPQYVMVMVVTAVKLYLVSLDGEIVKTVFGSTFGCNCWYNIPIKLSICRNRVLLTAVICAGDVETDSISFKSITNNTPWLVCVRNCNRNHLRDTFFYA